MWTRSLSGIVIAVVGITVGVVFGLWPSLDLAFAALFYDTERHAFIYASYRGLEGLRDFNQYLVITVAVGAAAMLAIAIVRSTRARLAAGIFLVATLLTGPGLIVNVGLKSHWGRPRPGEVTAFGGEYPFVPWWNPLGRCESNCSFVSGEAASAFWLLAVAVVLPERYRPLAVVAAILYGLAVGLARIAIGGHFLSDVLFAGVATALIIYLLHRLIFHWLARPTSSPKPDATV